MSAASRPPPTTPQPARGRLLHREGEGPTRIFQYSKCNGRKKAICVSIYFARHLEWG